MSFLFCRPSEIWSYSATVTTSAGATDADYTDDWITDARQGRPARSTSGTVTWSLAFSSAEVGLVTVCNCNASVDATIGGGVSTTVLAGALDEDGVRVNGFALVGPASITGLTVAFSANPTAVVLGELIGAKVRTLARGIRVVDTRVTYEIYGSEPGAEFASMNSYDKGMQSRVITATTLQTKTQRDLLRGWFTGQRGFSKPGLIVPDSTVNDAWVVWFRNFSYAQVGPDVFEVTTTFQEIPRKRWP